MKGICCGCDARGCSSERGCTHVGIGNKMACKCASSPRRSCLPQGASPTAAALVWRQVLCACVCVCVPRQGCAVPAGFNACSCIGRRTRAGPCRHSCSARNILASASTLWKMRVWRWTRRHGIIPHTNMLLLTSPHPCNCTLQLALAGRGCGAGQKDHNIRVTSIADVATPLQLAGRGRGAGRQDAGGQGGRVQPHQREPQKELHHCCRNACLTCIVSRAAGGAGWQSAVPPMTTGWLSASTWCCMQQSRPPPASRCCAAQVAGWCRLGFIPSRPSQSMPRAYCFIFSFFLFCCAGAVHLGHWRCDRPHEPHTRWV